MKSEMRVIQTMQHNTPKLSQDVIGGSRATGTPSASGGIGAAVLLLGVRVPRGDVEVSKGGRKMGEWIVEGEDESDRSERQMNVFQHKYSV